MNHHAKEHGASPTPDISNVKIIAAKCRVFKVRIRGQYGIGKFTVVNSICET